MCPHCIHQTSHSSYQTLCLLATGWPDPLSSASGHCCEFLSRGRERPFPPTQTVFFASSHCHNYFKNCSFPAPAAKAYTHSMPHISCHREFGIPNSLPCSLVSAWQDTLRAVLWLRLGLVQSRMLTLQT